MVDGRAKATDPDHCLLVNDVPGGFWLGSVATNLESSLLLIGSQESCAKAPRYLAVGTSVKLVPKRPIRAGILSSEHSARQDETWQAAALPTELLPPGRRVAMMVEGRRRGARPFPSS
jgi:hypothetical protein